MLKDMEIPLILYTRNSENLVRYLFDGNRTREIILDRAKLSLKEISYQMEKSDYKVEICVTMLTPFGAAAVSNFLNHRLHLDSVYQIQIGSKNYQFFGDKIRESLLEEYSRLHK
ncbi:MAG: hypothetical protein ACE5RJ_02255 [Nitrosopumilaceae archaeon]